MTHGHPGAPGEKNLDALIETMTPAMEDRVFVFVTVTDLAGIPAEQCELVYREAEGISLIMSREDAQNHGLDYVYPCRKITLSVQSSLEAVGFLAKITARLAQAEISVNAISAYYHDHLFVPVDRAEETMMILHAMRSH